MELTGVRRPEAAHPEFLVEPDAVDGGRVALPMTDRVAVPGGLGIFWMGSAIHIDDAPRVQSTDTDNSERPPTALIGEWLYAVTVHLIRIPRDSSPRSGCAALIHLRHRHQRTAAR
jgi:hypothetical protein